MPLGARNESCIVFRMSKAGVVLVYLRDTLNAWAPMSELSRFSSSLRSRWIHAA